MRRAAFSVILGATVLAASEATVFGQSAPAPPTRPALVVEQIESGWLLAPDVRATELGDRTGALAGGYLGRITDRTWVIGAGGYMLTNRDDDFKLWYGGPVFEWLIRADRKIGFGVRTLVGVGSGTLSRPLSDFIGPRLMNHDDRRGGVRPSTRLVDPDATIAVQDDFFVAEPQLNLMLNLTRGQRIVFGVGYRAVGNAPYLGDDLRGLSGSVSFQVGGK